MLMGNVLLQDCSETETMNKGIVSLDTRQHLCDGEHSTAVATSARVMLVDVGLGGSRAYSPT